MTKTKKLSKLFLTPKQHPKKNPKLWANLLTSISKTGHTSGPTSENYIQGYQKVFEEWGIMTGRNLDLRMLDRVLSSYHETGLFPEFKH